MSAEPGADFRVVAIGLITPSPRNVRRSMDPAELEKLQESIRTHGILQPLLARPAAAGGAGLKEVPVTVRELDDRQVLEIQMEENLKRSELHPLDEAEGYAELHAQYGRSIEEIAAHFKVSGQHIRNRLRLLELPPKARELLLSGALPLTTAMLVTRIPNPVLAAQAAQEIAATKDHEALSIRNAQDHIRRKYMLRLDKAPFALADAELHPQAGACQGCPKRSGTQRGLFQELGNEDLCLDLGCHAEKVKLHGQRLLAQAKADGRTVLTRDESKRALDDFNNVPWDSAFVKPDSYVNMAGWSGYPRQELGQDLPPTAIAVNPKSGEVVELVAKKDLRKALKTAGLLERAKSQQERAAERKEAQREKAQAELDTEVRRRVLARIVREFEQDDDAPLEVAHVLAAAGLAGHTCSESGLVAIARRRGLLKAGTGDSPWPGIKALQKLLDGCSAREALGLLAEMLLVEVPQETAAAAKYFEVDVAAIEAAVRAGEPDSGAPAAQKQKTAPKAKATAKTKAKAAPKTKAAKKTARMRK